MDFIGTKAELALCQWLAEHQQDMQDALATLVNIESGSTDLDGIRAVRDQIASWLQSAGVLTERIETSAGKPAIWAQVGQPGLAAIYLTGHMDTVFPKGTILSRPFRIEGNQAFGPGVADMKAGLVMNTYICLGLQALLKTGGLSLRRPVELLFTPDEEIGSIQGRHLIENYIQGAFAVLNAEPARMNGNVVSSRKGGDTYLIEVKGRAAHAGVNHEHGVSAIEALARIIPQVHALTDYEHGITTNIGVISGGQTSNTVADSASARLDVRFIRVEQRETIQQKIQTCVSAHGVAGATATLTHQAGFLPFEASWSETLLPVYQQQAQRLGFQVAGEFTGGCSDAGWTSALGVPTLCGTGPIGGWAHTEREYCDLDSQVTRAQAVALTILTLDQHQ